MFVYDTALFIFRRDLRLIDNTALNTALSMAKQVIACFIFDDRQIKPHPYQSQSGLCFMHQSLSDLVKQFQAINASLTLLHGLPDQVVAELVQRHKLQAVFVNRDYTPFSRQRDVDLATACQQLGVVFHRCADTLLTEPEQAVKYTGEAYKVFTAFYTNAKRLPVSLPHTLTAQRFLACASTASIKTDADALLPTIQGGRVAALQQLEQLSYCKDYINTRDFPALHSTSQLSAHLKFGTVSVREVFYAIICHLGAEHPLLRQLYWRDFLTHIGYHFPRVFGHAFIEKYDKLVWQNNIDYFQAWTSGKTGFPIVDAGMRELKATGNMHNRVRMIVASFLIKDLHISWRWGERYFAQHLVDYDPCVNNGNWQWVASTGCDAQPYFRIFNPWLQQKKFDPDCTYIYQWLPELRSVPSKILHEWSQRYFGTFYPAPIVDHRLQVQRIKAQFKDLDC